MVEIDKIIKNPLNYKWRILFIDDDFNENSEKNNKDNIKKFWQNFFKALFYNSIGENSNAESEGQKQSNKEDIIEIDCIGFDKINKKKWYELIDYDFIFTDILEEHSNKNPIPRGPEILKKLKLYTDINVFPLVFAISKLERHDVRLSGLENIDYFFNKPDFVVQYPEHFFSIVENVFKTKIHPSFIDDSSIEIGNIKILETEQGARKKENSKTDEIEKIIHELIIHELGEYEEIYGFPFGGGFSGAKNYLIEVKTKTGHTTPYFLKVDYKDTLSFEKFAYQRYIKGRIENFSGRISDKILRYNDEVAILYTGVGSWNDYLKNGRLLTLLDYIENGPDIKDVERVINILFGQLLRPLHSVNCVSSDDDPELKSLLSFYDPRLRFKDREIEDSDENDKNNAMEFEILESRIEKDEEVIKIKLRNVDKYPNSKYTYKLKLKDDFSDDDKILLLHLLRRGKRIKLKVSKPTYELDFTNTIKSIENGRILENWFDRNNLMLFGVSYSILTYIKKQLNSGWVLNESFLKKLPLTIAVIHGDLNVKNVMLSLNSNTIWLIDFDRTRKGHLFFDFTELEITIRNFILSTYVKKIVEYMHKNFVSNFNTDIIARINEIFRVIEEFIELESRDEIEKNIEEILKTKNGKSILSSKEESVFRAGVYAIKFIRDYAFSNYTRSKIQRLEYFASLALFAISTLKFADMYDVKQKKGAPITALWMLYLATNWLPEREKIEILNKKTRKTINNGVI